MRALVLPILFACVGGKRAEPPEEPTLAVPADAPRVDVKAPGNLPVRTDAELAAEAQARAACVETCLRERQAEARAIELIEADCQHTCQQAHPMDQVEIVPALAPARLPDG